MNMDIPNIRDASLSHFIDTGTCGRIFDELTIEPIYDGEDKRKYPLTEKERFTGNTWNLKVTCHFLYRTSRRRQQKTPGTGHRSNLKLILFQPEQLMKGYRELRELLRLNHLLFRIQPAILIASVL